MKTQPKIIILTYYWPPSGGSGVQRWMYFAKYLQQLGWEPIVVTVNEKKASYAVLDATLNQEVASIRVVKTNTCEPLQWYSFLTTGSKKKGIPQGEVNKTSIFRKIAAYIRGNFFIPDARKGWGSYAYQAAKKIIDEESIDYIVSTGPPHSTHLVGMQLQQEYKLKWFADFRDPWSSIFYNRQLFRTQRTERKDLALETNVLRTAAGVITTVGGELIENLKSIAPNQNYIVLPNGFDEDLFNAVEVTKELSLIHI